MTTQQYLQLGSESPDSLSLEPMYPGVHGAEMCRTNGCCNTVPLGRWNLGYRMCLQCGEKIAKKESSKHTIVPMHKSNYVFMTAEQAMDDTFGVAGINNKSRK